MFFHARLPYLSSWHCEIINFPFVYSLKMFISRLFCFANPPLAVQIHSKITQKKLQKSTFLIFSLNKLNHLPFSPLNLFASLHKQSNILTGKIILRPMHSKHNKKLRQSQILQLKSLNEFSVMNQIETTQKIFVFEYLFEKFAELRNVVIKAFFLPFLVQV